MFYKILLLACMTVSVVQAQDIQYVSAENGLIVREDPNRGAIRVGLLDYGSAIEIIEHTNLKMDVLDKGSKIEGEWVKIKGLENYESFEEGYVFNGFLTEEKLKRPYKIPFEEFTIFIEDLEALPEERLNKNIAGDSAAVAIELGVTPENKVISIQHHQDYRTIEVFQRHENSITIMDEGPHCDLIDYTHFYSSWKPLKTIPGKRKFKSISYSEKDWSRFVEVDMEDLIAYVKEECGESWSEHMKNTKSISDYPVGVLISKIYFRVVMTDVDGYKTEKIIVFDIPMGC